LIVETALGAGTKVVMRVPKFVRVSMSDNRLLDVLAVDTRLPRSTN
jgi:hypothetical protein